MRRARQRLGALSLGLLATSASAQATAQWGLKMQALAATPVAAGAGSSERATVEPTLKWANADVSVRARARLRWQQDAQAGRRELAELRELSGSWRQDDWQLTLGAQQLHWGRMDILRLTDLINPVDQSELFHEELPEAKRPLWMANLEWAGDAHSLQVIATPQVPQDRLPREALGLPIRASRPANSMEHATLGLRYAFEWQGWNADLVAVEGWDSAPTLRLAQDAQGPHWRATPARQRSLGFSADRPFGPSVLRLEGLIAQRRLHGGVESAGEPRRRRSALGAGLDLRQGDWLAAAQATLQQEGGSDPAGSVRYLSLIVQRKWLQDRLAARALHIRELRSRSSWSSLQLSYELSPHQLLQLQGDWFQGPGTEGFGLLRGRSRLAASLRLQF